MGASLCVHACVSDEASENQLALTFFTDVGSAAVAFVGAPGFPTVVARPLLPPVWSLYVSTVGFSGRFFAGVSVGAVASGAPLDPAAPASRVRTMSPQGYVGMLSWGTTLVGGGSRARDLRSTTAAWAAWAWLMSSALSGYSTARLYMWTMYASACGMCAGSGMSAPLMAGCRGSACVHGRDRDTLRRNTQYSGTHPHTLTPLNTTTHTHT